jgi:simple sugar transport system substrate-binding protein
VLRDAIENKGIPVVAANIPDFRDPPEKIPYLTYVGADEYLTGYYLGQHLAKTAMDGAIPRIKKVVTCIQHVGHMGLENRARGMADAMKEIGVMAEKLAIGDNPAEAKSIMNSYLIANPDVNVVFTVASWTAPWAYEVAENLNLSPDVDNQGVTILTVDASPAALEGILEGKLLSTHSQGFYMQGWVPAEWLYFYNSFGYEPPAEILTGPIVIDKNNAQKFKNTVQAILGKDTYDGMILWKE